MVHLGLTDPSDAAKKGGFHSGHQIAFFPVPRNMSFTRVTAHLPRGLWNEPHGLYFPKKRKEGI